MATTNSLLRMPLRRIPSNQFNLLAKSPVSKHLYPLISVPKRNTTTVLSRKYVATKEFSKMLAEKNFPGALEYYRKELKNKVNADTFLYREVIEALIRQGDVPFAFEVFQEMCARGVAPNLFVFHALLSGLAKEGNYSAAFELMVLMKGAGHCPTAKEYHVLMEECGAKGKVDAMELILKEMEANGFQLEQRTFCQLLYTHLVASTSTVEAHKILARVREAGMTPQFRILSLAFLHALKDENLFEATKFLKQALGTEIPEISKADAVSYIEMLMDTNIQNRKFDKAMENYEYFSDYNLMPTPRALRRVLISSNKVNIGRITTYATERFDRRRKEPSKVTLGAERIPSSGKEGAREEKEKIQALALNERIFPIVCRYALDHITAVGNPSKYIHQMFTMCEILDIKAAELSPMAVEWITNIRKTLELVEGGEAARNEFEERSRKFIMTI